MRWGTLHEDLACDLYECYHHEVLRTPGCWSRRSAQRHKQV
jgi:hypothetical protein